MKSKIIFIHGMFENSKSWENWITYFNSKGYESTAVDWPLHEGEPATLRQNPPSGLGDLRLATIIYKFRQIAAAETEKPIMIGHSVGGLIVQVLVNEGLAKLGVAISPVAPNDMISFDWGFFKNSALITNPLKGDDPFMMDLESFHESFCNTLTLEQTKPYFEKYATNDSRNVLRDCLGSDGRIDLDMPHVPLLFIGAEEDQIIPTDLVEKNAKAYTDEISSTEYRNFSGRGHFICGQPGWEEVAGNIADWLQRKEDVPPFQTTPADRIN
ncbi:alpha/beta hydrolase [Mucilaginibacter robiniae]|uniref:Alpha/beta hydrolase n=1 Tax=Mucilaginibacter robiniae TaxID=2728022 RepID=A0A7L5E2U1_9SPHI|nr:alpha/beta hydrolase [Mucilaginibacter robiniae]QJD97445.1 alpha/beta hydrolase [Mucilaginibacter robiniae]